MAKILLADSGSTKTDWALLGGGPAARRAQTGGLNPFQVSPQDIADTVAGELLPVLADAPGGLVGEVRFYGAGCTAEKIPVVREALTRGLRACGLLADGATVEVASDMVGAAMAVLGRRPGIACILGTGSNSCAWDGSRVTANVPPLGFILGDEGSGAVLGRTLVGDVLKGQLPPSVTRRFFGRYGLTAADITECVYRKPQPNAFLASFAPFLQENLGEPSVRRIVSEGFRSFLRRNVRQYADCGRLPIGFVGGVAMGFRAVLEEVMREEGLTLGKVVKAPIDGLVQGVANG